LNGENDYPETHAVIETGVEWEYENDNDKETLQTTGPLRHGILIMVLVEIVKIVNTLVRHKHTKLFIYTGLSQKIRIL